jgi:hypothetical protein
MAGLEPELIFVFVPEPLGPIDRGDKYEDPIIDELERLGLGQVTGGAATRAKCGRRKTWCCRRPSR